MALQFVEIGHFYISFVGSKVNMTSDFYKIIDVNGNNTKLSKTESESKLTYEQAELLSHSKKCFSHCRHLENAIEHINQWDGLEGCTYFPLIIGRRPTLLTAKKCFENINNKQETT